MGFAGLARMIILRVGETFLFFRFISSFISKNILLKNNRIAVSAYFLVNGFLLGNWTARIPAVKEYFAASNSLLGILLFCIAAGAMTAMPFTATVISRFGSHRVTVFMGVLMSVLLPFLVVMPNVYVAGIAFFGYGFAGGSMDVAMNGQAVYVERDYKRPIMSSFHAVFSAGMAAGAAVGGLIIKTDWTLFSHFLSVGIVSVAVVFLASRYLINALVEERKAGEDQPIFIFPNKLILPLGLIAFCSMVGEGTMADWSALYMENVVGQSEELGSMTIFSFGLAMLIGRSFGDHFTNLWGTYIMLRNSSLLAIFGLTLMLTVVNWPVVLGSSFLLGLGLATIAPIVYSASGNTPGVAPSVGIAMATTVGYAGFFVGPPTLGFLADAFGLRLALLFTLALLGLMLVLAVRLGRKR